MATPGKKIDKTLPPNMRFINSIRQIGKNEFPLLWESVIELSKKAGNGEPRLYVYENEFPQATAARFKGKTNIAFATCFLEIYNEKEVSGAIGHEMGHLDKRHSLLTKLMAIPAIIPTMGALILPCWALVAAGAGPAGAVAGLAIGMALAWVANSAIMNAIERKHEIEASVYSVKLNGTAEGLRSFLTSETLRRSLEYMLETSKGFKKFILARMLAGRFDAWDGASFKPKNAFETIMTKIVHVIMNDHPSMKKELARMEKAERGLAGLGRGGII